VKTGWMMEGLECQDEDLQFIFYSLGSLSELDDMLNLTSLTTPFLQRGKLGRKSRLML
jgi:hypothetical protein